MCMGLSVFRTTGHRPTLRGPEGLAQRSAVRSHVLPTTYNRQSYQNTILYPLGPLNREECDKTWVCNSCHKSLCAKQPKHPRYPLANFLYYSREEVLPSVPEAFVNASPFELMSISCAHSSVITHHYSSMAGMSGRVGEGASQRFKPWQHGDISTRTRTAGR